MTDRIGDSDGEFSVAIFCEDGTNEYVRRWVSPEEAVIAFKHYTESVAARMGLTTMVRVTDALDCTNLEWIQGKGITFGHP